MKNTLLALLLFLSLPLCAQYEMPHLLSLKAQGELQDRWLEQRAQSILPGLMQREGIDIWILIAREYNEDPVLKTMLPSFWLSARRTTMLVIYDTGDSLETLACARYDVGAVFKKAWDKEQEPDQWARLRQLIEERDPKKIAVNRSEHFGLADGLSAYHYDKLRGRATITYRFRLVLLHANCACLANANGRQVKKPHRSPTMVTSVCTAG